MLVCLYTKQDIMGLHVICIGIVNVICANKGNSRLRAHPFKLGIYMLLLHDPVIHELKEEIIFPECLPIPKGNLFSLVIISPQDISRNLSCKAGR